MGGLDIQRGDAGGRVVFVLIGEIDIATAPSLRSRLVELLAGTGRDVVLDLAGVSFLDSSGLGVVVAAHKRARVSGRRLLLCGPQEAVAQILRLTRMDSVLPIYPSLADIPAPRAD